MALLAFLSISVLFITYLLSYKYISPKMGVGLYTISVFIITFLYNPGFSSDLGRYFLILNRMKGIPINEMNYYGTGNNLFVINLIFWIIANIGIYHLLPAISTSTVFGIGAYITVDCLLRKKQSNKIGIFLLLQFLQLPFFGIVDNVRNIWAFSLVILAVYRDIIQKKKNLMTLFLYILPCFMHDGVFLIVAFRLLVPIAKKLKYVLPFLVIFVGEGINFLYAHVGLFPSFIATSISNGYQYLNNSIASDWIMHVKSSSFFKVQRISEMTIAVLFILLLYLVQNKMDRDMSYFSYFVFLILIAVLACNAFAAPHYWRYYAAATLCIPAILSYTFSIGISKRASGVLVCFLQWSYIVSSILMFALNLLNTRSSY